jgi:hypothetical protein
MQKVPGQTPEQVLAPFYDPEGDNLIAPPTQPSSSRVANFIAKHKK